MPTPSRPSGFDPVFADRANDLMGTLDLRGRLTYVNVPAMRVTQRSEYELLAQSALELVPAVHREEVRAFYARQIERRLATTYFEVPIVNARNRIVWLALHAHLRMRGSRVAGLHIVARDLTERKLLEANLKRSETRERQLFEECPAAIVIASPEGHVRACNPAFVRLAGFTSIADAVGSDLRTLYAKDALTHLLRRVQAQGAVHEEEAELRRVDGRALHTVQTLIGRFDDRGETLISVVGYIIDDTPRKALQTHMRHAMRMEAVGRIAGGLAHDFNNLLMIIIGLAEGLIERLPAVSPSRAEITQILEAGTRGAALAAQLLNASRKQPAQVAVFDLDELLRSLTPMLTYLAGPSVNVEVGGTHGPKWVNADRSQIEQVVLNLATNARDAMPQGGNFMIYTATADRGPQNLRGAAVTRRVVLTVHDTGVGMTAETQARVFEPFFTTKDRGKGTGLGLWQVQTILEENGGFIDVESIRHSGTTFTISLPLTAAPVVVDVANGVATPEEPITSPRTETILVVDDEAPVRVLLADALRRLGYHVLTAEDATTALALLREHSGGVHLLLTDLVMPGKSGRDLARDAQQLQPRLPILFMSGYPDRSITSESQIPRSAFLQKPFALDVLALRVRQMLDDRS